jgi:hypothetical protein
MRGNSRDHKNPAGLAVDIGNCFTDNGPVMKKIFEKCKADDNCFIKAYGKADSCGVYVIDKIISV